jgi:hypothetical protein
MRIIYYYIRRNEAELEYSCRVYTVLAVDVADLIAKLNHETVVGEIEGGVLELPKQTVYLGDYEMTDEEMELCWNNFLLEDHEEIIF